MASNLQRRPRSSSGNKKNGVSTDQLFDMADEAIDLIQQEKSEGGWMVTFGDMMTLLLTFFVMLYAMSELKMQKFIEVASSMREGFGVVQQAPNLPPGLPDSTGADSTETGLSEKDVDNYLRYINRKLKSFVANHDLENTLQVTMDETGVTLEIQDLVLFDEASAELKPKSRWIAEKLSVLVNEIAVPVIVSGHTDSKPISTDKYPSNWELSGARASTLARLFIAKGFNPKGIHIEGYAEYRPVATNDTPEGRAKNRRVELLYTRQNVFAKLLDDERKGDVQWWQDAKREAAKMDSLNGDSSKPQGG